MQPNQCPSRRYARRAKMLEFITVSSLVCFSRLVPSLHKLHFPDRSMTGPLDFGNAESKLPEAN